MTTIDTAALMRMAEGWANEAGMTLQWRDLPQSELNMLVEADASKRAHWRCSIELADACAAAAQRSVDELLGDLSLEPVAEDLERPRG